MAAYIDFLQKDDNYLYPITVMNAVYDADTGKTLTEVINTINTNIAKSDVLTDYIKIDDTKNVTMGSLDYDSLTVTANGAIAIGTNTLLLWDENFDKQILLLRAGQTPVINFIGKLTATQLKGPLEGNADTATKLAASHTINGTAFDGSADIITDKWGNSRKLTLSGGASGSVDIDGSANVTLTVDAIDATKITGVIPLASIPKAAQERVIPVADMDAMYALTADDAQNGDVVKVIDSDGNGTTLMYYIVDETKLNSADGYQPFAAGIASTANTLATPRTINGTAFDGSTNITTSVWGTARTIGIGESSKSVNGSANVSWTLAEIGAAPTDHTHNYAGSTSAGGAADSAVKLATARKITVGKTAKTFDGTADIAFTLEDLSGVTTAGLAVEVDDSKIPKNTPAA